MPIIAENSIVPRSADAMTVNDVIGIRMFDACLLHFSSIPRGMGIGNMSCNAAVAVNANQQFGESYTVMANGNPFSFSLVYGTSLAHRGLDPAYNNMRAYDDRGLTRRTENSLRRTANLTPNDGRHQWSISSNNFFEHAEQTAILTAGHLGAHFFTMGVVCHLYIDYRPCPSCRAWLDRRPENWYLHVAEGAGAGDTHAFLRDELASLKQQARTMLRR